MTGLTAEDAAIIAKLDKPGAGIPLYQKLYLKWYVSPFIAAKSDWEADTRSFNLLNRKILDAVEKLDDAQLAKRVLVPPQQGLEDSSRYWSAAMTLEHLLIVGKNMKAIIISLSKGVVPDGKADTARVKPAGAATPQEILAQFRDFSATAATDIDRDVKDRKSTAKFAHPWFGPFMAHQWHWVLAAHTGLHLKQLRAIIAGLT
jgi:hypothetical protein